MKTSIAWFKSAVHSGNTWTFDTPSGTVTGRITSWTQEKDGRRVIRAYAKLSDGSFVGEGIEVRDAENS